MIRRLCQKYNAKIALSGVSSTGENAIPASPNARDEFHEVVVLRADEFVKKFFSLYCHSKAPFE